MAKNLLLIILLFGSSFCLAVEIAKQETVVATIESCEGELVSLAANPTIATYEEFFRFMNELKKESRKFADQTTHPSLVAFGLNRDHLQASTPASSYERLKGLKQILNNWKNRKKPLKNAQFVLHLQGETEIENFLSKYEGLMREMLNKDLPERERPRIRNNSESEFNIDLEVVEMSIKSSGLRLVVLDKKILDLGEKVLGVPVPYSILAQLASVWLGGLLISPQSFGIDVDAIVHKAPVVGEWLPHMAWQWWATVGVCLIEAYNVCKSHAQNYLASRQPPTTPTVVKTPEQDQYIDYHQAIRDDLREANSNNSYLHFGRGYLLPAANQENRDNLQLDFDLVYYRYNGIPHLFIVNREQK